MLLLVFRVAEGAYAVAADRVVEVVPRVALRGLPHAPEFLAGLLDYRGKVVPVVDLGALMGAGPCRPRLGTRIIVAARARRGPPGSDLLGMVAEHVHDVREVAEGQAVAPPMPLEGAPYLGAIVRGEEGLVQCLDVDRVVTDALAGALFRGTAEGEGP